MLEGRYCNTDYIDYYSIYFLIIFSISVSFASAILLDENTLLQARELAVFSISTFFQGLFELSPKYALDSWRLMPFKNNSKQSGRGIIDYSNFWIIFHLHLH